MPNPLECFGGIPPCSLHQVVGLHNWLRVYMEEKAGLLDYRGCTKEGQGRRGRLEWITLVRARVGVGFRVRARNREVAQRA